MKTAGIDLTIAGVAPFLAAEVSCMPEKILAPKHWLVSCTWEEYEMRRIIAFLALLTLTAFWTACGSTENSNTNTNAGTPTPSNANVHANMNASEHANMNMNGNKNANAKKTP
jgi:hypothetical protein